MAPPKSKLTEEERWERNKKYCKKYRNSMKVKQPNAEAERKQYERLKVKLQNPELYELKKAEDRERARMHRMRKKAWANKIRRDTDGYNNGRRCAINLIHYKTVTK